MISAKTELNSHLLLACASRGIPVIILDPRSCEHHAQYIPPSSGIIHRKIKQFEILDQDQRRLGYAKQLVYAHSVQQYKLARPWPRSIRCLPRCSSGRLRAALTPCAACHAHITLSGPVISMT